MTKPTKPTKPAGFALSNPVPQTKWEAQREKERITMQDHPNIPHRNSTMREARAMAAFAAQQMNHELRAKQLKESNAN